MAPETRNRHSSVGADLPEFAEPPLFETVFGVRFPRLEGWDVRHFGLFWDRVRSDYPEFETKQPLASPEHVTGPTEGRIAIQLLTEPQVRCWYLIPDGTRLLQVQHDGFFHNWRKVKLDEVYPRYEKAIRPMFEQEWGRFHAFLEERGVGSPDVVQCEATYVNHFVEGHEWSSISDLPKMLKWWGEAEPAFTRVRMGVTVSVGDHDIDVTLTPAVRRQDRRQILQFSLTVKGQPGSSDTSDVLAWMDGARAAIVRGFTDLTTDEMHSLWKRIQ